MRARRLLLIFGMILAGAVVARPEEVIPLATRLVRPMLSQHPAQFLAKKPAKPVVVAQNALPSFVPDHQNLKFDGGATGATSPEPSASAAETSSASAETGESHTSRSVDLVATPDPALAAQYGLGGSPSGTPSRNAEVSLAAVPPSPSSDPSTSPPVTDADGNTLNGQQVVPVPGQPVPGQPAPVAAKSLFGAVKTPSPLASRAIGSYARGCLAGAVALPVDGPAWQSMRLSRNRQWGHPHLVALVERLATDSKEKDGWPGLLVGDMSQPRGGPMLSGHASHQVGLDADVWLTPMPNRRLSDKEREDISATSMLDKTDLAVDPNIFTPAHVQLIKRAASYPEVERVLVHPAIKKALCRAADSDRAWLGKVRPIQGHYYHFHIRIGCPPGSFGCVPQRPPTGEDGCGKEVDEWLARLAVPPRPAVPGAKPSPPPQPVTMTQLPAECRAVLETGPGGIAAPADIRPPAKPASAAAIWAARHHVTLQPKFLRHAHK